MGKIRHFMKRAYHTIDKDTHTIMEPFEAVRIEIWPQVLLRVLSPLAALRRAVSATIGGQAEVIKGKGDEINGYKIS